MVERRRAFVPVLAAGVLSAILTAVASTRDLLDVAAIPAPGDAAVLQAGGDRDLPLAATLSMVVLACWGVVLVTRRRARRLVAALGSLAALGVLVTVIVGWWQLPDGVAEEMAVAARAEIGLAPWYWVALVGAAASAAASVAAVLTVGAWPEMGTRYDRPSGSSPPDADDDLALWKALDGGRDPTA